jgi:hypothetical protein
MIPLGAVAQDSISGFTGVVVARTDWLHGCTRLTIQPSELHDGAPVKSHTFDEPQLRVLELTPSDDSDTEPAEKPGGPGPEPVTHQDINSR